MNVTLAFNQSLARSLVRARALGLAGASAQARDFDPMLALWRAV